MDGEGPSSQGGSIRDTRSGSTPVLRRVSVGVGAHLLDRVVSGVWSEQEKLLHINLLEIKALFLALQSFQELVTGRRVTAMWATRRWWLTSTSRAGRSPVRFARWPASF